MLGAGTVFWHPDLSVGLIRLNKEQYCQDSLRHQPRAGTAVGRGEAEARTLPQALSLLTPKTEAHSETFTRYLQHVVGVGVGAPENPVLSLMNSVPKIKPVNSASAGIFSLQ